jgi:beta-aspartyl-peptidase (threonine type)
MIAVGAMISRFAIPVAGAALLLVVSVKTVSGADRPKDPKAAIQKVLDDQVAAWNKGDLEGFMAGYWKSPDLSFYSGKDKTRGWQATYERYRKRYQAEGREMGKLTFSDIEIEVLGPDSAFVRGRFKLATSKEDLGGLYTLIFKKLPEGWRIVHDHTSG